MEGLSSISKLHERHIIYILNFLPKTIDEVNLLFANERIVLEEDEKKKIIDVVKGALKT